METILVELKHEKALQLLQDLEALEIIQMHKVEQTEGKSLSEKYRGILSKSDFDNLNSHINEMRQEWDRT